MIRYLLLHRIEWTDRHPGLMLALLGLVTVAALSLEGALP